MNAATSKDPQWDQVIEIAAKLWVYGEYVAELNPSPTQRFVDLQLAARQAGGVLGGRTTLHVSPPRGLEDPTVTVTATYVDPYGRGLERAEAGLEKLLRMVLAGES
jgi:hypothetical protein